LTDASGTVALDASGNGRNATYEGSPGTDYSLSQPGIVSGLSGALKVYATDPGAPKVLFPTVGLGWNGTSWQSDFTMAEWVKPDPSKISQFGILVEVNEYYLMQGTKLGAAAYTPAMGDTNLSNWASPINTFADGAAHLIAMSVHQNSPGSCTVSLYVDAALATTASTSCEGTSGIVSSSNAGLGGRVSYKSGAQPFFGEISGAAIFSSALSGAQIMSLYGAAYPAPAAPTSPYDQAVLSLSPFAYYRLNERSGAIAYDASGNNRNGTYNGVDGTDYAFSEASILPADVNNEHRLERLQLAKRFINGRLDETRSFKEGPVRNWHGDQRLLLHARNRHRDGRLHSGSGRVQYWQLGVIC